MTEAVADIADLTVSYRQGRDWLCVVEGVSFTVARGEVFGLVGESGCGKSTVALQLLGFRHNAMRVDAGAVRVAGENVVTLDRPALDRLRGAKVSFVPQNPTTALNPGMGVGSQVEEILTAHGRPTAQRVAELFTLVGLPADESFLRRFPHQLSGGQQQRVCIAMALACDPQFVVLDEPTTGLDVTTQEQIVDLLNDLRARLGMSMLYVTHDLGLLSQLADRIGVMYAGHMVEVAPTPALFASPRHPYTRGLIAALPRIDTDSRTAPKPMRGLLQRQLLPRGCPFAPRCDFAEPRCSEEVQILRDVGARHQAACWRLDAIKPQPETGAAIAPPLIAEDKTLLDIAGLSIAYGRGQRRFEAVRNIDLRIARGETVALVGESGSGKSTLAKAIAGLEPPAAGTIKLGGEALAASVKHRTPEQRRLIQFVFQNPDASLNPRATIEASIERPLAQFFPKEAAQASERVRAALADVRLDASYTGRYPDQLSGGERQRVAIARALIARPDLLLCDEILSALDVSVQANVLALLHKLKTERGIAMLFISHDLAVVRLLADRVHVLFRGVVMEEGTRDQVFAPPFHPYTFSLLEAVPRPLKKRKKPAPRLTGDTGKSGCAYAGRCAWQIGDICVTTPPPWWRTARGLAIRCHHDLDELQRRAATSGASTGE